MIRNAHRQKQYFDNLIFYKHNHVEIVLINKLSNIVHYTSIHSDIIGYINKYSNFLDSIKKNIIDYTNEHFNIPDYINKHSKKNEPVV